MLIKVIAILICTLISGVYCIAQTNSSKKRIRSSYSHWMSLEYRNCLKTNLPCECENSQEFFLISMDTANQFVTLYEGRANYEHGDYDYKAISNTRLEVYVMRYSPTLFKDTISVIGQIFIKKDTLFFIETNKKQTKFILYNSGIRDAYFKEHITLLNRALEARGYDKLSELLKSDSLKCWCNWELGGINIVFDWELGGKNIVFDSKKNWILERKENDLYIYEWINPPRVKTLDAKIEKRLLKKLKW